MLLLPLSVQLVWVGSPRPSAVVSKQPNGHRWLGLFCLLQPSWHGSLGRLAAPWPAALMGHSNTAITSWCFVSIRVAQDELWLLTLKYGSSGREIQQCVKHCQTATVYGDRVLCISARCKCGCKCDFIHDNSESDDMVLGHPSSYHH